MLGIFRLTEHKAEGWRQCSEFRRRSEGEIDLQSAREQKYSIYPRSGSDVQMMQSQMPIVHVSGPIEEDIWHFACVPDAKGEIYIRPSIFA